MPLTNGRFPECRCDGDYVHFKMEDSEAIVRCAVTIAFLDAMSQKNGLGLQHHRTIFTLYRREIEQIASRKYDEGDDRPLITIHDLPR